MFKSVTTNKPDRLTAANILKKWFFCRDVGGAGRIVVVEYLEAVGDQGAIAETRD